MNALPQIHAFIADSIRGGKSRRLSVCWVTGQEIVGGRLIVGVASSSRKSTGAQIKLRISNYAYAIVSFGFESRIITSFYPLSMVHFTDSPSDDSRIVHGMKWEEPHLSHIPSFLRFPAAMKRKKCTHTAS